MGLGSGVPLGMSWQVPRKPATLHARHLLQAEKPQQTPSVQCALAQSVLAAHTAPSGFLAQVVPMQKYAAAQSASMVQLGGQTPAAHLYAPQAKVPLGGTQAPLPLHRAGGVAVLVIEHEPAVHTVPAGYVRQAPPPSHLPSVPQPDIAVTAHTARGSTVPAATGAQLPRLPATLHARQVPHDAVPQHTPSTQLPVAHSGPSRQVWPAALSVPHWLIRHAVGATQSLVVPHMVAHAVPAALHLYGAHDCMPPLTQVPLPSHAEPKVSVLPPAAHEAAPHAVPARCLRQPPAPLQVPSEPQVAGC